MANIIYLNIPGLMKCSLQEFQHMFPQLTSCIKSNSSYGANVNNNIPRNNIDSHSNSFHPAMNDLHHDLHFSPMECPTLPLDTRFMFKNMLHDEFSLESGPLWRVQLIDESTMDLANLKFGPELSAILEDQTTDTATRWRYFLRYHQGNVNQVRILQIR